MGGERGGWGAGAARGMKKRGAGKLGERKGETGKTKGRGIFSPWATFWGQSA